MTIVSSTWEYLEPTRIRLRDRPELGESWAKEKLMESPQLLQLGGLVLIGEEARLPSAGRLDLLFQNPEAGRMYEVEIQVGSMNSSHVLRGVEYWGTLQALYPEYDHYPVLVAENVVSSRFLKAVRILNAYIPFIVLEMRVLQLNDQFSLELTKVSLEEVVVPEMPLVDWPTDPNEYREKLLEVVKAFAPDVVVTVTKGYTGLRRSPGVPYFAVFRPRKAAAVLDLFLAETAQTSDCLKQIPLGFKVMIKRSGRSRYRIQLAIDCFEQLGPLLAEAYEQTKGGER